MNETTDITDPVQRLAAYRPDPQQLAPQWRPEDVRATLSAGQPGRRVRFLPRRIPISASLATAAAIVALMVGVLAVVVHSGDDPARVPAMGSPYVPGTVANTPAVGPHQFAYRVQENYAIAADGTVTPGVRGGIWTAPDGELWLGGHISAVGCYHAKAPTDPDFGTPSQAFFDAMPTNATELDAYLRDHVQGSSSQDEAIFVGIGDMLRDSDLLATSALRAAAVTVLGRISAMTVHPGVEDYLGRAAVRVDYVDQALRPGELQSLYFDPSTYQLLEERSGTSGAPTSYDGPSPAYTAHVSGQEPSGDLLTGAADISVMTQETVVDSVPDSELSCVADNPNSEGH